MALVFVASWIANRPIATTWPEERVCGCRVLIRALQSLLGRTRLSAPMNSLQAQDWDGVTVVLSLQWQWSLRSHGGSNVSGSAYNAPVVNELILRAPLAKLLCDDTECFEVSWMLSRSERVVFYRSPEAVWWHPHGFARDLPVAR